MPRTIPVLTDTAMTILCKRYLLPKDDAPACPRCGKKHESPSDMFWRASFGNEEFYEALANLKFMPNSPVLFNTGTGQGTFSACFFFRVPDSMDGISDVYAKSARVQKWGGGVGYDLSDLRAEGMPIRSTHGKACGPLAVIRNYQALAEMITQGGKRDGAQLALLHCSHPDIRKFIHLKDNDPQRFSTFNISVAVTDNFMIRAEQSDTPEAVLFDEIVDSAWRTGDPGLFFDDTVQRANPTPHLGRLGANPCGEVTLLDKECCTLTGINLTKILKGTEVNDIDWHDLEDTTRLAVRYLDTIIDNNQFPDPSITEAVLKTRKIGLGVMGLADLFAMLRIPYDSDRAVELADALMSFIQQTAHNESARMAEEFGTYSAWRNGCPERRHASVTCIAPTGTTSLIAGASSGIEPHFTLEGTRKMGDGTVLHEGFNVNTDFIPKTMKEIDYRWHIKMQATFQKYVDLSISKTCNLPNSATRDDIKQAFLLAWKSGCKGTTVFRDGCRGEQVITDGKTAVVVTPSVAEHRNGRRRMPTDVVSARHKFAVGGTEGYLHAGTYPEDGKLGEIFINMNNMGSTISGLMDGIAILTSMALQYGVPLEALVKKMQATRFEPAGLTENKDIPTASSLLSYIYTYLGKKFLNGDSVAAIRKDVSTGMFCPDCGAPAVFEEGCLHCAAGCGWSRC